MTTCEKLGIADKVQRKSNRVKKNCLLLKFIAFTLNYQGFGLSALEAMMMGVPVISSNVGGLPEVNIEGQSGFYSM